MELVHEASANGQTVLLSSHVLSEIERAAHRVGVLHRGELVRVGALADMRLDRRRHVRATVTASEAEVDERMKSVPTSDLALETRVERGVPTVRLTATTDDVDALVKLLARYKVRDLIVSEPVLEDTVLELYRDA